VIEALLWLVVCASVGLLCLAVGAIFFSIVAWSYRSSELREILKSLQKGKNVVREDPTQQST